MKLIIFILIVLIIAALFIRIILRSVNQPSPLLMQLHTAGVRTGDAERILSSGEYWQRQKTLLTEREVSFMKGLLRIVDIKRWYLCPQVRARTSSS
ncbi:w0003 [Escherichia coli]|nr:w0003 [Escherichia coli]CAD5742583.1 w0003 [Escherichia coli]CAD5782417.1 w0003 [Escherichia coli]CAD5793463.1 w0003 [Escherichia coli]CAD5794318.1 w0003 [Escherichia coli]